MKLKPDNKQWRTRSAQGWVRIGKFLLAAFAVVLPGSAYSAEENSHHDGTWTKESFVKRIDTGESFNSLSAPQLLLDVISWNGERLVGRCTYHNLDSLPVVLEGREVEGKGLSVLDFYPDLSLQVSNEVRGEWKTIGVSPSLDKGKAILVSMAPNGVMEQMLKAEANRSCYVEMDSFRSFIGKFAYGRLLLKNGGLSQVFQLDNLSPPKK